MANPIHIPAVFAEFGIKNPIQKTPQSGQDPQDATWTIGWSGITMIKIEDGGKAPKGQDFNGIFNALGAHIVHGQNGGRYVWSQDVIDNFGGYAKDSIISSNDGKKDFLSLVDSNTTNPNVSLGSNWKIYAGEGSVPNATSVVAGLVKVINSTTSTDINSALSAAQGKFLKDLVDTKLNSNQVVNNLSSTSTTSALSAAQGRELNNAKVDRSGDTITGDLAVDGVMRANVLVNVGWGKAENTNRSIIFYNNFTERARIQATTAGRLEFVNATSYGFDKIVDANISGNSGSATRLATARTINGVSFDGTQNINLPTASITGTGTVQLNDSLTSTSVTQALTANQGKVLNDKMLGVGQSWQNLTASRSKGVTYTNNTGRPIEVCFTVVDVGSGGVEFLVGGVRVIYLNDIYDLEHAYSVIVPAGSTYILNTPNNLTNWAELR